jgi:hypothetical protein
MTIPTRSPISRTWAMRRPNAGLRLSATTFQARPRQSKPAALVGDRTRPSERQRARLVKELSGSLVAVFWEGRARPPDARLCYTFKCGGSRRQYQKMIEATQFKLGEARFFLDMLRQEKENYAQPITHPLREPKLTIFWYYLSSFLNASRSVMWVLQSEEKDKYDAWSPSWDAKLTDVENELFNLITSQRNTAVKRGRFETTSRQEKVPMRDSTHPIYGFHSFGLPEWGSPWTIRDVHYFGTQEQGREIVATCSGYLDLLTKIVQDFLDKHAASC